MRRVSAKNLAKRRAQYTANKERQATLTKALRDALPQAPPPDVHDRALWSAWSKTYREYTQAMNRTEARLLAEQLQRELDEVKAKVAT
jgi:hypothetical protein